MKEIEEDEVEMKQSSLPVLEKVNVISLPFFPILVNQHNMALQSVHTSFPSLSLSLCVSHTPAGVPGCWREGVGVPLTLPPHPRPLFLTTVNSTPNAAATTTSTTGQ